MAGKPIAGAMAAARAFAARRASAQELAFVAFNSKTQVVLPFTRSDAAIAAAARQVTAARLRDAHLRRRAHGGAAPACGPRRLGIGRTALGRRRRRKQGEPCRRRACGSSERHSRLHGRAPIPAFRPELARRDSPRARVEPMREESKPSQLAGLYNRLGLQLASEYLLRYRSLAGPQEAVNVAVRISGIAGTARTRYQTPALAAIPPTPPYHRSLLNRVSLSPITAGVVVLLCALLVGLAIASVIRPRRSQVQRRMSEFVTLASAQDLDGNAGSGGRRAILLEGAEHVAPVSRLVDALQGRARDRGDHDARHPDRGRHDRRDARRLRRAHRRHRVLPVRPPALVLPLAVRAYLKGKLNARRRQFAEQLPDSLQIIASALRAGHGLAASLSVVVESASDPMKSELQRVIAAEQLGAPLDDALCGRRRADGESRPRAARVRREAPARDRRERRGSDRPCHRQRP